MLIKTGFICDQVFLAEVSAGLRGNARAAFVAIFFGQFGQIGLDHTQDLYGMASRSSR